jgi:hypothetical protein
MKLFFLSLALLFCGLASAQTAPVQPVLTWSAPTTNTDGSAFVPGITSGYNIYIATSAAALTALPNVGAGTCSIATGPTVATSTTCANSVAGQTLTYTTVGLPAGTWYFAVTAWNQVTTGTYLESVQSVQVSTTVTAPVVTPKTPSPPAAVKIT